VCGVASRDKPDVLATKRVNHYKNLPSAPKAHCNEALFSFSVGVWAMQSQRIIEKPSASANDTPCFLRLLLAFEGSYWKCTTKKQKFYEIQHLLLLLS
jgi:hypothetical protein